MQRGRAEQAVRLLHGLVPCPIVNDVGALFEGRRFRPWRRALAIGMGAVAVGAAAGAAGLATASLDLGATIVRRLPFQSTVVAAVALLAIVALPMAWGAVESWLGRRRANVLAVVAGALLVGWIVVELAVIRAFSWLQPMFLFAGAAIAFAGYRGWHLRWGPTDN